MSGTMYLTAQRVTNPTTGATGINCFLHLHGRSLGITPDWRFDDVNRISNQYPGEKTASKTDLSPGGNRVLSYLEIVSEDTTKPSDLLEAITAFAEPPNPDEVVTRNDVSMFFFCSQALPHEYRANELDVLKNRILEWAPEILRELPAI
ncbi:MAG: hypothetical protein KDM64_07930 [Verrucomicrobiae bacterium]|nr:hypothetical protein [Verrucomicrobiae bacterium]MCB1093327.1 hypothetical protein [Verrucomicrobiae bacterium]